MADINLELLGRRLETIQSELREIRFNIELERKRFDNLSSTLGHQLGDVEGKLTSRLDGLESLINDRSAYVEQRFDQVETRLERIEQRFEMRFEQLDQRFARIERLLTKE